MKKAVSKPQTPARKLKDYVSTGHADSPATIVVGRAHQQKVVYPTGAAPRLVANTALLKKNMKMDEDLTGISEMYKTPVNERKRRSVMKTPVVVLGTSVVEPSVLNTPEEPGEMMVSPLSITSAVKDGSYSSEAVQRFLNEDQESSFINDIPAVETQSDSGGEQCTHSETTSVATPKQKPEQHECLAGVKRIMKTPRRKAEPVEDLRGRLLKTPKQKLEQQECLTGVKRIMKTPRQKAEPVEDLRGKILKTPKQKLEQQECLTGVKRIMKTPRQKAEPVEDLRGKILKTPKQKLEQQECLSAVKRIFETPQRESEPLIDLEGKLLATLKALEAGDAGLDGVKEIVETPVCMQVSEDLSEMADMKTPNVKSSPLLCLTDVKRIMKTPKEKNAPVEDMVGVKRLMKTPKEKAEPVEKNFGLKRLMKSPRLRGNAPVEDFEGLQELMEEPLPDPTVQLETNEAEDPQDDVRMDVIDNAPEVDIEMANTNEVVEEVPIEHDNKESPEALETISQVDAVDEIVAEEQPKVETSTGKVSEIITTTDPVHEKKSVRGRRAKVAETNSAEDKEEATEQSEEPVVPAPVRGRRGKKTEATAPPAVKQTTRGRNATVTESQDVEMEQSASLPEVAIKPKRGRNAKKASDDQAEIVQEVAAENMPEPESEQSPPVYADHEENDSTASTEKAVLKPKRGRRAKQSEQTVTEQQDVPQADMAKEDANEGHTDQLQGVPGGSDENKSSDAPATEVETAVCEVTEMDAAPVSKKSVRGRRAKVVESEPIEDTQDVTEQSEEPVITAPVRGRRGKKTEAAAPPAVKQTRGRNAKSQQSAPDQPEMVPEKVVEATLPEISTEAVSDQISPVNTQEETDSAPPAEEAVVKPTRGRKTKAPVVPPQSTPEDVEVVSDEHLIEDAQPQKSIPKPRRGRKAKPDTVEQNEVAEDTVVVVETKPPVRAKRGRNAKQEEEKLENDDKATSVEAAKSQEPVQKLRRTRKAEQDHVEPTEVQAVEVVVPEEAEAPVVTEPVKTNEQATVPTKLRRGGRKAKQDTESETPVDSTEVQEVPAVSATDKPKRGRRGKQVTEMLKSVL
ncbi:Proliferation marker protein [Collichthys lucidus]|uniref:Proliferation marker protein n=1 Tax=Collichthys lucidus TaxID=240159 RepID=A0A4U5VNR5_COLLU|nr:Proliferation marker protein [Collichthys lucidus]